MADISRLSRLLNGVQRQVDLSTNTLVVDKVKVGGTSGTDLSKTILDRLISLQDGTDVDATYHTHDGRYFTESELGSSSASSGSDLIGDDNTYSNFTPAAATVKGALSGIDSALATAGAGTVKISAADTTAQYLGASIVAGAALTSNILNPGANETLNLDVAVDGSTIEVSSDALRIKDLGVTAAKLAADSVTTSKILDANVTNAKIATGVDAAKIGDGSVSNTEFQYLDGVTSSIQTQLNGKVAKAGDSMSSAANLTFSGGGEVLGLPSTPTTAGSAASKAYVDAVALGLAPKKAVRVATTAAGTLASSFENGDTVDGVTLATGDRILIKNQAAASENGIYTVNASGAPTRATDFDSLSPIDEINGSWVPVQFGTVNAGRVYVQYGAVTTLGTDPINFEFYNPIASLIGGDMVTVSGSTISLDLASAGGLTSTNPGDAAGQLSIKLDGSTLSLSGSGLKVATGGITNNEISASAAIVYSKLDLFESIVDSDISTSAGISYGKLNLSGSIVDADVSASAAISYSKLSLNDSIVDADISSSAAIAYSKLDLSNSIVAGDLTSNSVTLAKLAADSVDENKIVSTAHDSTMSGGSGSKLSVLSSPSVKASGEVAGEAYSASTLYAVRYGQNAETAGRVYKADNDASSTDNFHVVGLALTVGALSAAGTMPSIVKMGLMTVSSHGFTVGKPVWLGASGALTSTAPSAANSAVVKVGMVKDANTIDVQIQVMGVN